MDNSEIDNSLEGYELVYGEESYGGKSFFGLKIFVRLSERKLRAKEGRFLDNDEDDKVVYRAAREIKRGWEP